MDVFITPEARRELEVLRAVRPRPSAWGVLIGHKRGFRFIVEKVFPAAGAAAAPSERLVAELDRVWPGRVIGLFAVRPGAAFKKAVLGPAWYGKLIIHLSVSAKAFAMRPSVVEFKTKFFPAAIPLAPAVKAKAHE